MSLRTATENRAPARDDESTIERSAYSPAQTEHTCTPFTDAVQGFEVSRRKIRTTEPIKTSQNASLDPAARYRILLFVLASSFFQYVRNKVCPILASIHDVGRKPESFPSFIRLFVLHLRSEYDRGVNTFSPEVRTSAFLTFTYKRLISWHSPFQGRLYQGE